MWSRNILILAAAGTLSASPAFAQQQKTKAPASKSTATKPTATKSTVIASKDSASKDSTHATTKRKHSSVSKTAKSEKKHS
jgi:hypothetical protein